MKKSGDKSPHSKVVALATLVLVAGCYTPPQVVSQPPVPAPKPLVMPAPRVFEAERLVAEGQLELSNDRFKPAAVLFRQALGVNPLDDAAREGLKTAEIALGIYKPSLLDVSRKEILAAQQQLVAEVNQAMADARRALARGKPTEAVRRLEQAQAMIRAAELDTAMQAGLKLRVTGTMARARKERELDDIRTIQHQRAEAELREAERVYILDKQRHDRVAKLLERSQALAAEHKYQAARIEAERALNAAPGSVDAMIMVFRQRQAERLRRTRGVLTTNERSMWENIFKAWKTGTPNPEEPPLDFPDSSMWQDLTRKRSRYLGSNRFLSAGF